MKFSLYSNPVAPVFAGYFSIQNF